VIDERFASVRVVVFDIDDTLFLEEDYIASGFAAVGAYVSTELGVEGFAEKCLARHAAGERGRIFDSVLAALGLEPSPALVQELVARYRSHRPTIDLAPDARPVLDALSRSHRLAAISDGPLVCQQAKVEVLGLSRWLDPIVLTGAFGPGEGKPHPRAFREIEQATGHGGSGCLYLADNPAKDFIGPRALGWRTIRIERPRGLYRDRAHAASEVDLILDDLEAIPSLLGR
jgi:putative hydrolase of the HAD superfamily